MLIRLAAITMSAALLIVALVAVAHRDSPAASAVAPPFDPGAVMCFENLETAATCDGNSAPGAVSDLRADFCVGWGPACTTPPNIASVDESLYSLAVLFVPAGFVPASAATTPVGALAGYLASNQVLGILNGPCSTQIQVSFTLLKASVDTGNVIQPKAAGLHNPFEPLAVDISPMNGIPDGVDKYPAFLNTLFASQQPAARLLGVTKQYGQWLPVNLVFFAPGASVTMGGRTLDFDLSLGYPAIAVIQNPTAPESPGPISDFCAPQRNVLTLLGSSSNNPCTPEIPEVERLRGNCPLQKLAGANNSSQNVGYPYYPCDSGNALDEDGDGTINDGCPQVNTIAESGADCDNATSDEPSPATPEDSAINDGCPAIGASEGARIPGTCSAADEGGCVLLQNPPSPGGQTFTIWTESYRDADDDGIENQLDVCSLVANGDWNPHIQDIVNDTDGDGLPNVCDPNPNVKSGINPLTCEAGIVGDDQDKDCLPNREDNCPLNNQLSNPSAPPDSSNLPNAVDSDKDGIGNACDPSAMSASGDLVSLCLKATLQVGSPATPVTATQDPNPGPGCATGVVGPTPTPAPVPPVWGDIDCSGAVNSVDALKLLRWKAGLVVTQPLGCPVIGAPYP